MSAAHQPIQPEHIDLMNNLARALDGLFNRGKWPKVTGFALLVFPFGQPNEEHIGNYISNADREDMIAAMKEFIARAEGRYVEPEQPGASV